MPANFPTTDPSLDTTLVDGVDDVDAALHNQDSLETNAIGQAARRHWLIAELANTQILSGAKTLVDSDPALHYLDPDGANRDVNLPAEADANHPFYIVNTAAAAFNLVIKDDSPATIATINQDEAGIFYSDGTTWRGAVWSVSGTLSNIVEDLTPQLGANLDVNEFDLVDSNGNELIELAKVASAVNQILVLNAAAGNPPEIQAAGETDVDLKLVGKGTGRVFAPGGIYQGEDTLTDAAGINWDVKASPIAKVTLGDNRSLNAPTNLKAGQFYTLRVIQDGTGTRLLVFNAVFEWEGGNAPTLSTAADAVDLLNFYCYDGTNLIGSYLLNIS